LSQKSFRRLGDVRDRHVDIRLIASTNIDLEEAVRAKKFRDDLYYRVSTLTLRIPPLRERPEDIPILARAILMNVCRRMGKAHMDLGPEAEALLLKYAWPGNIRELANVLERAMILQRGERLEASDLGLQGRTSSVPEGNGELLPLRDMERLHIERVLQRTAGNVSEAAQILGMARRTLYDRMKTLGLATARE
jgi:DNA-binding NtrC family response regulator